MKDFVSNRRSSVLACLSFGLVLLFVRPLPAQTRDLAANLSACKYGWTSCDRSRLTPSEAASIPPEVR